MTIQKMIIMHEFNDDNNKIVTIKYVTIMIITIMIITIMIMII